MLNRIVGASAILLLVSCTTIKILTVYGSFTSATVSPIKEDAEFLFSDPRNVEEAFISQGLSKYLAAYDATSERARPVYLLQVDVNKAAALSGTSRSCSSDGRQDAYGRLISNCTTSSRSESPLLIAVYLTELCESCDKSKASWYAYLSTSLVQSGIWGSTNLSVGRAEDIAEIITSHIGINSSQSGLVVKHSN